MEAQFVGRRRTHYLFYSFLIEPRPIVMILSSMPLISADSGGAGDAATYRTVPTMQTYLPRLFTLGLSK
jgi:hypothetical protein